jgi:hypothetical protein
VKEAVNTENEVNDAISSDDVYRGQLIAYRSEIQSIHRESQTDYDKTIVTICSGALVATIGFFDKLHPTTPKLGIILAWIFWSLGLISIILSFAGSVKSLGMNIDHLDKFLSKNLKRSYTSKKTIWDKVIKIGNTTSFIFLVVGIFIFAASIGWGVMNNNKNGNEPATTKRDQGTKSPTTTSAPPE